LLLQQLDFIFIFIFGKGLDKQDPILADKAEAGGAFSQQSAIYLILIK